MDRIEYNNPSVINIDNSSVAGRHQAAVEPRVEGLAARRQASHLRPGQHRGNHSRPSDAGNGGDFSGLRQGWVVL